jgi:hypothetical protein
MQKCRRRLLASVLLPVTMLASALQIVVEHQPDDRRLAEFTRATILAEMKAMPDFLKAARDTIRFRIVSTQREFLLTTGADLPYWVEAVTLFPQDLVVIRSPDLTHATLREYRKTIAHELVHLLQGQVVPLNLTPVWFNEGLAVYCSGGFDFPQRVIVSKALFRKKLIPLEAVRRIMRFGHPLAELAYAESASAVEFLAVVYGNQTFAEIFGRMQAGMAFEKAVAQATASDYADLLDQWQNYLRLRYEWIFLLDIQNILWLIIPFLAVVAYVGVRRRNKATLRQWKVEDAKENIQTENI